MSSAPSPDILPPTWTKALLWSPTPSFKLDWRVMTTCRFSKVAHLKNALNDDQPVLVGRDGQEIEAECGRGLVGVIDLAGGIGPDREAIKLEGDDIPHEGGYHLETVRGSREWVRNVVEMDYS